MYQVRTTGINSFNSGIHEHELDEHDEHELEHEHDELDEHDEHDDHVQNRFSLDHMPTAALIDLVNEHTADHPELQSFADRWALFPMNHKTRDGRMIPGHSAAKHNWTKEVLEVMKPLGLIKPRPPKTARPPKAQRAAPAPPVHHHPSNDIELNVGGHVVTVKNPALNTTVQVGGAVSSVAPNTRAAGKAKKKSEYHRLKTYLHRHKDKHADTNDMLMKAHTKCYGNDAGTVGDKDYAAFHKEVKRLAQSIQGFNAV
jgi:hypothetical protein